MKQLYGVSEYAKLDLSGDLISTDQRDIRAEIIHFPGGEPHIKLTTNLITIEPVRIYQRIKSFKDFGVLAVAVDALRGMSKNHECYISLVLPYFPGARQDRVASGSGEALTVKVYADLINSLNLDEVVVIDPHSEAVEDHLDRCTAYNNIPFFLAASPEEAEFALVSPDAGATNKTKLLLASFTMPDYEIIDKGPDIIQFSKHRDPNTGRLSNFVMENPIDLNGMDCVLVDDICDGGGTFIAIAKILKEYNAGNLHLVVTHGIFSKGTAELKSHFETISTTDSFMDDETWLDDPTFQDLNVYSITSNYKL